MRQNRINAPIEKPNDARRSAACLMWQSRPGRSRGMLAATVLLVVFAAGAMAADRTERELDRRFAATVHPFLETYCFACHGEDKQKGKLDLRSYSGREVVIKDYRRWELLRDKLKAQEMPPEEAKRQPPPALRQQIIDWIQDVRKCEAQRNAGDPGPVFARRLSNAEFDYTIRDLTGIDIRPAREFPVDPANEAGFDNSAESLAMSPALLKKYLEATRRVAEHVVFKPDGFTFAPHPMVTETDRDKYCVQRIIDFYQRQRTDYADYFMAAWRFKHRAVFGKPRATLMEFATADKLSAKYLATIWSVLTARPELHGPLARLQTMWAELPAARANQPELARRDCERMRDFVVGLRERLKPTVTNLSVRGIAAGSQPFVLWKDRQMAANHWRYEPAALRKESNQPPALSPPEGERENRRPFVSQSDVQGVGAHQQGGASADKSIASLIERALLVSTNSFARARAEAAFDRFARIFPDAFYVSERVLVFLKEDKDSRGRLLSAGFHLMTGYFRDDEPLTKLLLDEAQQRELDRLWNEFHFITLDTVRQYKDFIFFERAEPPRFMQGAEFDFARSEDKDATSASKMQQLADAYLAKAQRNGATGEALKAIQDYFKSTSTDIRNVEQARRAAEPNHLHSLQTFAERAYRRPLSQRERDELLTFYRTLRDKDGLEHEDAIRDAVVSILMSPSFCYRSDGSAESLVRESPLQNISESRGQAVRAPFKSEALSDYALANRLSYFLWSSMPDDELMAHAKAGDLHRLKVLRVQTRRMLQDERIRGLATEFGGNWLDFRRFEEHNGVDRARFPSFNNELRTAMFEEPLHFFIDLVRRDGSVLDFVEAEHTFVNPILARHYGMTNLDLRSNQWARVEHASRYGRGGLLPMAVFLTKNSPGLRTSPVKRGYWVVRRLLGEQIPPPPPTVPELPSDEAKLGDLTLREALAKHREDKSCAACHARFDGFGLVFEGYGPIGEQRAVDLGGRMVDTRATLPSGGEGDGIDGLRRYLHDHRQQEFLDNLCRKLLAYALSRTLLLSDEVTIDSMRTKLRANDYRFSALVETVVASPQFLNRRTFDDHTAP